MTFSIRNVRYISTGETHKATSKSGKVLLLCKCFLDVVHTLNASEWQFTSDKATCPECIKRG